MIEICLIASEAKRSRRRRLRFAKGAPTESVGKSRDNRDRDIHSALVKSVLVNPTAARVQNHRFNTAYILIVYKCDKNMPIDDFSSIQNIDE